MVSVLVLVAVAALAVAGYRRKKLNERRGGLEEVFDIGKPIEEDPITAAGSTSEW